MSRPIVLGTRGSDLALAQTSLVEDALRREFPRLTIERKIISTSGDRRLDLDLRDASVQQGLDKGLFTRELEEALFDGRIDVAIHSLKDLPTTLPPRLTLGAVLPRADERDVLVSRYPGGLRGLPENAVLATGSMRRQLQLTYHRDDLSLQGLRGNVPTRLQKLANGEAGDAIVLAAAGLLRLGYAIEGKMTVNKIQLYLQHLGKELLPAAGQGIIGLECLKDNQRVRRLLRRVRDPVTMIKAKAERGLLRALGGGCQMPLGVRTKVNGETLSLEAILFSEAGKPPVVGSLTGTVDKPVELARRLVANLNKRGTNE